MIEKRLKPKDLAAIWQCSQSHVLSLIRSGKLRAINIGNATRDRYLIDPDEVKRFESGQENAKPVLRRPKKICIPKLLDI